MSEQTKQIEKKLIDLKVKEYNIAMFSSPKLDDQYGEIDLLTIPLNNEVSTGDNDMIYTKISLNNTGSDLPDLLVLPGFSIDSHNDMLGILIKGKEFIKDRFRTMYMFNFGEKNRTKSKVCSAGLAGDAKYEKEDEFKKELAVIVDKLIRSSGLNLRNFTVLAKSAGGGIAFFLAGINPEVKVLMAACPGFHNNGTVVKDRKDLKIYIMWNMDDEYLNYNEEKNEDGTIKKSKRIEIMKQLELQGNDVTFYSYDDGGHELNIKFLEDTQ
jgi:hypothetical protein